MTDDMWDKIAERVAASRVWGVSFDDEDLLMTTDLNEAALNPNRAANAPGNMGGPGAMMPPMMMGGGGGQGGAPPGGGSLGAPASAPAPAPAAGPLPSGVGPLTTAPRAERGPTPAGGGSGGVPSDEPGLPSAGGGGAPDLDAPRRPQPSSGGAGGAPSPTPPDGGGRKPAELKSPKDGFVADPAQIKNLSDRWQAIAEQLRGSHATPDLPLGILAIAERPQQALTQQLAVWLSGAADEFEATVARLHDAGAGYQAVDDDGVARLRREQNS